MSFHVPNEFRVRDGVFRSTDADGNIGAFLIPLRCPSDTPLTVIASDMPAKFGGAAWEHVSVSLPNRCPTWDEMCKVKALFWDDEDTVVQFHPQRSQYINHHLFCLHMWRPVGMDFPMPPSVMVGFK